MQADHVLSALREREAELKAHGVTHAALFGSTARGEQQASSDIDILVELDPTIVVTVFDYAGVKSFVASLFDEPVDVVSRSGLKSAVRPSIERDAIYAF